MPIRRVLIVEDNATKQLEVEKAIGEGRFEILAVKTIAAAYHSLAMIDFDLIVLDMTFQASIGAGHESSKEPLAGVEILQFLANQRKDMPVIVATQHSTFSTPEMPDLDSVDELDRLLRTAFPRNFREIVEVDLSEDAWKATLRNAVDRIAGESGS